MRVVSLLVTTLLFVAPGFAQQMSSAAPTPAMATTTAEAPPAHPITPAQVHELLELIGGNKLKVQLMGGMWMNVQKSFPPFIPKDVLDDLKSSLFKLDFEPIILAAYQKHISTEDAAQVIAFYRTPAGQRLAAALPSIQRELQIRGSQAGMQVVREVIARHSDEIKAAAMKYKQEHSDTPKITSSN